MRGLKRLGLGLLALLAVASILPYLIPMPGRSLPPRKSPFLEGRFTEVCGLRWHFQRWQPTKAASARARVVLIHGFAGSTFSWRLTGPALAEAGYEALAIDLPPYGYTSRGAPAKPLAECVADIIRDEGSGPPLFVVGHSMGASVAARVAAELDGATSGLVLVDGGLGARGASPSLLSRALLLPPLSRWAEVVAHHHLLKPERLAATLASAYGRAPDEAELDGYRTPLLLAGTAPRILARGLAGDPLDVSRLPAAQLIVWGRLDSWVPPAVAERTAAALPRARVHWIDPAAHNPMETHPEEFMAALLEFIGDAVSPSTGEVPVGDTEAAHAPSP